MGEKTKRRDPSAPASCEGQLRVAVLVGKQIHLCKRSPVVSWRFPSLYLLAEFPVLPPPIACLLYLALALTYLLSPRNASCFFFFDCQGAQTAALSAICSLQPDCTAVGGYVTAVSGFANQDGRPVPPTGCCWPRARVSPSLTHTRKGATELATTHPPVSRTGRRRGNVTLRVDILFRQDS